MNKQTPSPNDTSVPPKKPVFLYLVIGLLTFSLLTLGILTFLSLNKLAALQTKVSQLSQTVQEISDSSAELIAKSQKLDELTAQQAQLTAPGADTDAAPPAEDSIETEGEVPDGTGDTPSQEGTLSPPSGSSTFTENTDESMDKLLNQINPLLPQLNGTWSVYVCNLAKGTSGVINDTQMQAASLIKLFIMGAVYEHYDALASQYGAEALNNLLNPMITVSDNDAANTLVEYLGGGDAAAGMAVVNQFCQDKGFHNTSMGRMLLADTSTGDNYTSASDCGRFLKAIYQLNTVGSAEIELSGAEHMYYLLKLQTRRNKIPAQIPEGVGVANKTGELSTVENDAAILYDTAKGIDLVICFMSQNLSDVGAAQASIAENSRLIYGYYNE